MENDLLKGDGVKSALKNVVLPVNALERSKKMTKYRPAMLRLSTVFSEEQTEALKDVINLCLDTMDEQVAALDDQISTIEDNNEKLQSIISAISYFSSSIE